MNFSDQSCAKHQQWTLGLGTRPSHLTLSWSETVMDFLPGLT